MRHIHGADIIQLPPRVVELDHTLHFILIYLGVNETSNNKYLSLGVASILYYVMIKKEMKKNNDNLPLFEYKNDYAIELKEIKCENA